MRKTLEIIITIIAVFALVSCANAPEKTELVSLRASLSAPRGLGAGSSSAVLNIKEDGALDWYYTAQITAETFSGEAAGETDAPGAITMSYDSGIFTSPDELGPFCQGIWNIEIYAVKTGEGADGTKVLTTDVQKVKIQKTSDGYQYVTFALLTDGVATITASNIRTRSLGIEGDNAYKLVISYAPKNTPELFETVEITDYIEEGGTDDEEGEGGTIVFLPDGGEIATVPADTYIFKAQIYARLDESEEPDTLIAGSAYSANLYEEDELELSGDIAESQYETFASDGITLFIHSFDIEITEEGEDSEKSGYTVSIVDGTSTFGEDATITYSWYLDGESTGVTDATIEKSALESIVTVSGEYTLTCIVRAEEGDYDYAAAASVSYKR